MNRRHTVLVVDDEANVVRSVQDLLRLEFRVLGAGSADEGLRRMQSESVQVVRADQRMPGTTGVEFLTRVRNEFPEAIRLLFTGYADIKAVIDAINSGQVYRYIAKPWDPDELISIVRQAAEQYDLLAERRRLIADLKQKNDALEAANADLRQANALKSAFIQVASHELRTPVMILTGLTELAVEDSAASGGLGERLERMHAAGIRLQRLIEDMIGLLARGEFSRPLRREAVDLSVLIHQAANDVQPFLERRRQTLLRDLAGDLGQVSVEPNMIRDSIDHVLMNAIKFTPDGGRIELAAERTPHGKILVHVRDTGCGIPADCLPLVFNEFFTGFDVSRHCSGRHEHGRQGLGLGLSIVKRFVEMHGGEVKIASELGRGTTVTIELPAV